MTVVLVLLCRAAEFGIADNEAVLHLLQVLVRVALQLTVVLQSRRRTAIVSCRPIQRSWSVSDSPMRWESLELDGERRLNFKNKSKGINKVTTDGALLLDGWKK